MRRPLLLLLPALLAARADQGLSTDLTSNVFKTWSNEDISGVNRTDTDEREGTTVNPEASGRSSEDYLRNSAFASVSNDGSAVAQAVAGSGTFNPPLTHDNAYPMATGFLTTQNNFGQSQASSSVAQSGSAFYGQPSNWHHGYPNNLIDPSITSPGYSYPPFVTQPMSPGLNSGPADFSSDPLNFPYEPKYLSPPPFNSYPQMNQVSPFPNPQQINPSGLQSPFSQPWLSPPNANTDYRPNNPYEAGIISQDVHAAQSYEYNSNPGNSFSRIITEDELIYPHEILGSENSVVCGRDGELHQLWSAAHGCLVCACAVRGGALRAACTSCATCIQPSPPAYVSTPPSHPISSESELGLPTQVSCDPLPMNQEFQNPLHPCQVCVCTRTNDNGKRDVRITCQESPQCVVPPDAPTIPPILVPSESVPLPLCSKMPQNVMFPHPTELCIQCVCLRHVKAIGSEPRILCQPNPDCGSLTPSPRDKPNSPDPYLFPPVPFPHDSIPQEPFARPDVPLNSYPTVVGPVTMEPPSSEPPFEYPALPSRPLPPTPQTLSPYTTPSSLDPVPWPPATLTPLKRGPLPGPPPHESCRPFPPNNPFEHPWDECQVCVCSEAFATGHVTVEVNCFTKPSCCVEVPAVGSTQTAVATATSTSALAQSSQLQILDKMCEFKAFGAEFAVGAEGCRVCACQLFGSFVVPVCRRAPRPHCHNRMLESNFNEPINYLEPRCRQQAPYHVFEVGCNMCSCQAIFNYVIAKCTPNPRCHGGAKQYYKANDGYGGVVYSAGDGGYHEWQAGGAQAAGAGGYREWQAGGAAHSANGGYHDWQYQPVRPTPLYYADRGINVNGKLNSATSHSFGHGYNTGGTRWVSPPLYNAPRPTGYGPELARDGSATRRDELSPTGPAFPPAWSTPGASPGWGTLSISPGRATPGTSPGRATLGTSPGWATPGTSPYAAGYPSPRAPPPLPANWSAAIRTVRKGAGRCQYAGDMYHERCQACVCRADADGQLTALCLGKPCS